MLNKTVNWLIRYFPLNSRLHRWHYVATAHLHCHQILLIEIDTITSRIIIKHHKLYSFTWYNRENCIEINGKYSVKSKCCSKRLWASKNYSVNFQACWYSAEMAFIRFDFKLPQSKVRRWFQEMAALSILSKYRAIHP